LAVIVLFSVEPDGIFAGENQLNVYQILVVVVHVGVIVLLVTV
jgi:hypothetical protein